jgi:hypothetical protein
MMMQIRLGLPKFFKHEDVLFLQVPVNVRTEAARIVSALLSHRSDDFECFLTLLGWYCHPHGRENHVLLLRVILQMGRRCLL